MSSAPSTSIVLPAYQAAGTIASAVRSMLEQHDAGSTELIVIDDGSDDDTVSELKAYRDRITLLQRPHRGLVDALNHGLRHARGEFIARMDADDISLPTRIQKQRHHLEQHPEIGLVSCQVTYGGNRAQQSGYAHHVDWCNSICTPTEIRLNQFVESPLPHPSVMFRRSLLATHGGYAEGAFPEDYDLWLRWLSAGVVMAKIPEELLIWHDPPTRLSRTDPRYSVDAFYAHKLPFLARWLKAHNPHHPAITLWGAGRKSRLRAETLRREGIHITSYIDIAPGRIGQRIDGIPVISPEQLLEPGAQFVVPFVGSRGARAKITAALSARGYRAGEHFICAS